MTEKQKSLFLYLDTKAAELILGGKVKNGDYAGLAKVLSAELAKDLGQYLREKAGMAVGILAEHIGAKTGSKDIAELFGAGAKILSRHIAGV